MRPLIAALFTALLSAPASALAQAPAPPVVAETIATAIPGVIAAGTKVEVIKSGFTGTEGPIGLPDGSLIFTETQANRITRIDRDNNITAFLENSNGSNGLAFDIKADGTVGNRRNFAKYPTTTKTPAGATNSGADGLAIDNDGRVYVVSLGGVHVFGVKGDLLGTIPLSLAGQNIAFAGVDKKTLFIVGRGAAFKVRLLTAGYQGRAK